MNDVDSSPPSPVDEKDVLGAAKAAARPQLRTGLSNPNMNGPLYMQTSGNKILVRRLKRKDVGTWKQVARWFVENQIGLAFNLLALLFLAHIFIPKARSTTRKFFQLSYFDPETGKYGIGFDDTYILAFCIVLFTGLRAATMEYVLAPFGKFQGISKRKDLTRFSEQAWLFMYCCVFWTTGMYIYVNSPYFLNFRELWTDWPNREVDFLMKGYILGQWAFWIQQIIVINIEDRRKDHWQMFSHHIITIALISSCYFYHFTKVGNFILIIMDVVDLFLPFAKCLKYCGYTTLCDYFFGAFIVSWVAARHVLHILVCYSVYADTHIIMDMGCYRGDKHNITGPYEAPPGLGYLLDPFYDLDGQVCFDTTAKWFFLGPLLMLQGLMLFWLTFIVRVLIKVLQGNPAEDNRSDDECAEEEDEYVYEEAEALEQEVGVEALDFRGWERRHGVKIHGNSSGVSLPGHSDRKDLLGRIGCEKQVD